MTRPAVPAARPALTLFNHLSRWLLRLWHVKSRVRVTCEGQGNLPPSGATIIICNQPMTQAWQLVWPQLQGNVTFFASEYLFNYHILGALLRWSRHLWVSTALLHPEYDCPSWRQERATAGAAALRSARQLLLQGQKVALFPEQPHDALSETDMGELRPFQPGLGWMALSTGAPIVPIVMREQPSASWKWRRIHLRIGSPITSPAGRANTTAHRAHLEKQVRSVMLELGAVA